MTKLFYFIFYVLDLSWKIEEKTAISEGNFQRMISLEMFLKQIIIYSANPYSKATDGPVSFQ